MAFKISQGLATKLAGTSGIKSLMEGGRIGIFTGAQPLTPELVETGTLIATISTTSGTAGVGWGTAGSYGIPKSATVWSGTCGVAGVAGWMRFYDTNNFTGADTAGTSVRFDGDIGTVTGTLKLTNTTFAVGATITIDTAQFTIPANQS